MNYQSKIYSFSNPNQPAAFDKKRISDQVSHATNIVVKKVKPRYIITSIDDFYYERTPYLNSEKYLTRYINIAFVKYSNLVSL